MRYEPWLWAEVPQFHLENNSSGTRILLIDDIYTKTVNIDEDAIQALLNKGARQVFFYAIGYTI